MEKPLVKGRTLLRHAVTFGLLFTPVPLSAADPQLSHKLTLLSDAGNGEAAYHLGMLYHLGLGGLTKDARKAFELFKLSAERGDPLGAYKYGCYFAGQGEGIVDSDPRLALRYKLVAAKAGYNLAQEDVAGHLIQQGDTTGGLRWLERAAEQGSTGALMVLGGRYAGLVPSGAPTVRRDLVRGYAYLVLAARNNGEMRAEFEAELAKLTPQERLRSREIIANWHARPTELTLKAGEGLGAAEKLVTRALRP